MIINLGVERVKTQEFLTDFEEFAEGLYLNYLNYSLRSLSAL